MHSNSLAIDKRLPIFGWSIFNTFPRKSFIFQRSIVYKQMSIAWEEDKSNFKWSVKHCNWLYVQKYPVCVSMTAQSYFTAVLSHYSHFLYLSSHRRSVSVFQKGIYDSRPMFIYTHWNTWICYVWHSFTFTFVLDAITSCDWVGFWICMNSFHAGISIQAGIQRWSWNFYSSLTFVHTPPPPFPGLGQGITIDSNRSTINNWIPYWINGNCIAQ